MNHSDRHKFMQGFLLVFFVDECFRWNIRQNSKTWVVYCLLNVTLVFLVCLRPIYLFFFLFPLLQITFSCFYFAFVSPNRKEIFFLKSFMYYLIIADCNLVSSLSISSHSLVYFSLLIIPAHPSRVSVDLMLCHTRFLGFFSLFYFATE